MSSAPPPITLDTTNLFLTLPNPNLPPTTFTHWANLFHQSRLSQGRFGALNPTETQVFTSHLNDLRLLDQAATSATTATLNFYQDNLGAKFTSFLSPKQLTLLRLDLHTNLLHLLTLGLPRHQAIYYALESVRIKNPLLNTAHHHLPPSLQSNPAQQIEQTLALNQAQPGHPVNPQNPHQSLHDLDLKTTSNRVAQTLRQVTPSIETIQGNLVNLLAAKSPPQTPLDHQTLQLVAKRVVDLVKLSALTNSSPQTAVPDSLKQSLPQKYQPLADTILSQQGDHLTALHQVAQQFTLQVTNPDLSLKLIANLGTSPLLINPQDLNQLLNTSDPFAHLLAHLSDTDVLTRLRHLESTFARFQNFSELYHSFELAQQLPHLASLHHSLKNWWSRSLAPTKLTFPKIFSFFTGSPPQPPQPTLIPILKSLTRQSLAQPKSRLTLPKLPQLATSLTSKLSPSPSLLRHLSSGLVGGVSGWFITLVFGGSPLVGFAVGSGLGVVVLPRVSAIVSASGPLLGNAALKTQGLIPGILASISAVNFTQAITTSIIITFTSIFAFTLFGGGYITSTFLQQLQPVAAEAIPPPTAVSCFEPYQNWRADKWARVTQAIEHLVKNHPAFVNKICASGTIRLRNHHLYPGLPPTWPPDTENEPSSSKIHGLYLGAWKAPDGIATITLYDVVFSYGATDWTAPLYTLTHESTHHLQTINNQLYLDFEAEVLCQTGEGRSDCDPTLDSYRWKNDDGSISPSEDFAESTAWYVMFAGNINRTDYDYTRPEYQRHYRFVKTRIFAE